MRAFEKKNRWHCFRQGNFRPSFWLIALFVASAVGPMIAQETRQDGGSDSVSTERQSAGTLFLVGGGRIPDEVRQEFFQLAGAGSGVLVLIPGASVDAETESWDDLIRPWDQLGWQSISVWHPGREFSVNQVANDVSLLNAATAVWIGGGNQNRLPQLFADIEIEQGLRDVIARGGVVGGTSAGAAIATRVMIGGGRDEPEMATGWDLLPNAITDQHFSERNRAGRLEKAIRLHPELLGVGIDEGTALLVQENNFRVMGRGQVHLFRTSGHDSTDEPVQKQVLVAGQSGNWPPEEK
jgi:cyanophycinase